MIRELSIPICVDPTVINSQLQLVSATPRMAFTVGIVGGVGSGKSAVAHAVKHALADSGVAAEVLDGDKVGHQTLELADIVEQIAHTFGESVIDGGAVSRKALATRVFGDSPEHRAARAQLESIVHPAMRREFEHRIQLATQNGVIVLFDAAVLFESGWDDRCDGFVFVDVPDEERRSRALARGWTAERWTQTEASQWTVARKRDAVEAAGPNGLVVTNLGPIEHVGRQVADWILSRVSVSTEIPGSATSPPNSQTPHTDDVPAIPH